MKKYYFLMVLCFLIFTSGCDSRTTQNTYKSDNGEVRISTDTGNLLVVLDPFEQLDTNSVVVTLVDLGDSFLIETTDPKGRFLPSLQIASKDPASTIEVLAPQIESEQGWMISYLGQFDTNALEPELMATVKLRNLDQAFYDMEISNGINLIMPGLNSNDGEQLVDVYKTKAPSTYLIFPPNTSAHRSKGLQAPARYYMELFSFAVESYHVSSHMFPVFLEALEAILTMFVTIDYFEVPDLIGDDVDSKFARWKIWSYQYHIRFDFESTTCSSNSELFTVIDQNPHPGTKGNFFELADGGITLYVCDQIAEESSSDKINDQILIGYAEYIKSKEYRGLVEPDVVEYLEITEPDSNGDYKVYYGGIDSVLMFYVLNSFTLDKRSFYIIPDGRIFSIPEKEDDLKVWYAHELIPVSDNVEFMGKSVKVWHYTTTYQAKNKDPQGDIIKIIEEFIVDKCTGLIIFKKWHSVDIADNERYWILTSTLTDTNILIGCE